MDDILSPERKAELFDAMLQAYCNRCPVAERLRKSEQLIRDLQGDVDSLRRTNEHLQAELRRVHVENRRMRGDNG